PYTYHACKRHLRFRPVRHARSADPRQGCDSLPHFSAKRNGAAQKRLSRLVVPIWVGRRRHATRESPVVIIWRVKQASGLRDETTAGEGDRDERAFSIGAAGEVGRAEVMLEAASPGIVEGRHIGSEPAFAAGERRPVIGKIGEVHADHQRSLVDLDEAVW